jgi:hypothetical protein
MSKTWGSALGQGRHWRTVICGRAGSAAEDWALSATRSVSHPAARLGMTQRDERKGALIDQTIHPAEYSRLALGLPRHGTCERMPQFCAAARPS